MFIIFGQWRMTSFEGWHQVVSRKVYKTFEEAQKDIPTYLAQVVERSKQKNGLVILELEGAKGKVLDIEVPLD